MYVIYINGTSLIISDFVPSGMDDIQEIDNQTFDFKTFYKQVKKGLDQRRIIITKDPKDYFRKIRKNFKTIKAAGGIVRNEFNECLFIFRKGKWDLPKGKLDEGEKTRVAAEREVTEECGIKISEMGSKLCNTWHVYEERGETVFKKTTWYNMKAKKQKLIPQLEEEITDAKWVDEGRFPLVTSNTYPLIKSIVDKIQVL